MTFNNNMNYKYSIYIITGAVELENLPLKREALRHIGLPVEIKAGFIGKVRLQVPVTQIRTASWVIAIEQLYLVTGPINLDEVIEIYLLETLEINSFNIIFNSFILFFVLLII